MPQHDRHVEPAAALRELHELRGGIDHLAYLGRGSANPHWRLRANGRDLIWRQFGHASLAPGADRARERAAHQAIAGRRWAPQLIAELPGVGMLFEASPGRHPDPALLTAAERAGLIDAVIECWSLPCPLTALDYGALIDDYVRRAGPHAAARELGATLADACRSWPHAGFCLVHHDLHAGNLLLSEDGWILLDWEYAARGHPGLDAAALDALLGLTPSERRRLDSAATGHVGPFDRAALAQWRAGLDTLWEFARQGDETECAACRR